MTSVNKPKTSYKISVQKRNLITLPRAIRNKLSINEGDVLSVRLENDKIVIEPYRLVPSSQAYFWNKKNQNAMIEAENDVKAGHVREFSTVEDYINGLEND